MPRRRKKRICDGGLRIEETIYNGEDPVVFITPRGQVRMASSIKKVTAPGLDGGSIIMTDCAEVYMLNEETGMKYRQLYHWDEFRAINIDLCEV